MIQDAEYQKFMRQRGYRHCWKALSRKLKKLSCIVIGEICSELKFSGSTSWM